MRTKHGFATGWKYDGTGWPDLTLTHASGWIVLAELKIPPNKRSLDQDVWAVHLERVAYESGGAILYRLWTPQDSDEIARVLSQGRILDWNLTV